MSELPKFDLPELEFLFFSDNLVRDIGEFCQSKMPKLKRLQGLHNQVDGEFPEVTHMPALVYVDMRGNHIEGFGRLARSHLPKLETLNLS